MLKIADREFKSRLFLGTGKFGSSKQMEEAVLARDLNWSLWH